MEFKRKSIKGLAFILSFMFVISLMQVQVRAEGKISVTDNKEFSESIISITAPEKIEVYDTLKIDLELNKDVQGVMVTYYSNDRKTSYTDPVYMVKEEGSLIINRMMRAINEYEIKITPLINNEYQEEVSKWITVKVTNKVEEGKEPIISITAPEKINVYDTLKIDLGLNKDVQGVKLTYLTIAENGITSSYSENYTVREAGNLTINRVMRIVNEYQIKVTPLINNEYQEENSKYINLKVTNKVEENNESIISITAPKEIEVRGVAKIDLELSKDVQGVMITYSTIGANGITSSYSESYTVKEAGSLTINRTMRLINEYKIKITPLVNGQYKEEEAKFITMKVS